MKILSFVRVLAENPDEVFITSIHGNPAVFEIKSCRAELDRAIAAAFV
jgi:hypothetical protein